MSASIETGRSPLDIVARLLKLSYKIKQEAVPHELEIIVQIYHECSREEAAKRLLDIGWMPKTNSVGASNQQ